MACCSRVCEVGSVLNILSVSALGTRSLETTRAKVFTQVVWIPHGSLTTT